MYLTTTVKYQLRGDILSVVMYLDCRRAHGVYRRGEVAFTPINAALAVAAAGRVADSIVGADSIYSRSPQGELVGAWRQRFDGAPLAAR